MEALGIAAALTLAVLGLRHEYRIYRRDYGSLNSEGTVARKETEDGGAC